MKKHICFFILLIIETSLFSNDSRVIVGSSVEIINNKDTNVIMQEEEIIITLHKDYYEVDVLFIFYNEGPTEKVMMGFPVKTLLWNNPQDKEWGKLHDFKTYINGDLLLEHLIMKESSFERNYNRSITWYLREVEFLANSRTHSRITYKAPYSHGGFITFAAYIFGTGRNWKNSIGKMSIFINHGDDILINSLRIGKDREPEFTWVANGKYKYELVNVEAKEDEEIFIYITPFDIYGKYGNEFGSWSDGWIWDNNLLYGDFSLIRLYTRNQINLFINFFYAYRGYDFRDSLYKNYFENLSSFVDYNSTRYKVNKNFSENDFTEIERKNIEYLRNLANKIP